jgi:hypothetical protein
MEAQLSKGAAKRADAGGKAEASGSNFEARVSAWYCVLLLAGGAAQPPHGLGPETRLVSVACQAPVDDMAATTSEAGWVFAQAKRTVNLSSLPKSSLAGALDQDRRRHLERSASWLPAIRHNRLFG